MRAPWPTVWSARWIWDSVPDGDLARLVGMSAAPEPTWNRFVLLRRRFELAEVPPTVPCRLTADSRFVLHVNGVEVLRGPARSVPERLAWSELDLAPHLRPGENAIAVQVRFYGRPMAWWRPARPSFQLGYGSFVLEAPAIGVATDATWKALPAPYAQDVPGDAFYPPTEILDGRELPQAWAEPGFDDDGWTDAVELLGDLLSDDRLRVPSTPFAAMEHDDLPPLTAEPQPLTAIGDAAVPAPVGDDPVSAYQPDDDAPSTSALVWDAGRITLATPWVVVRGETGAVVDLYAGEDLAPDGRVEIRPRSWALRYILRGGGEERVDAYEAVGFRYLSAVPRGAALVLDAGAIERRAPRAGAASFECDDERLNRIWQVGARTLDVCSTDAFLDCPGREQRAWVGDAYVHGLLSYLTGDDRRLARRNLRLCAHSQRPDGLLGMSATGDLSLATLTIPDYSLHWIRALVRHVEHTGDLALGGELVPTALVIADTFERWRDPDGLLHGLPGWVFVDWAQTERAEVVGAVNGLHAAALDDLAGLVDHLGGDTVRAAELRARAERTRAGFELLWDEGRGAYVDAADAKGPRRRISQQTNAAAIVSGCAPPARWPSMLERILDESRLRVTATPADLPRTAQLLGQWFEPEGFDAEHDVVAAQPFFAHVLHQAVAAAGRRDLVADLCRRWWPQIQRGNTTFEEYWDAAPGTASRAHAWAATPTYDLVTHILGVRPTSPGYATTSITPWFGDLSRLRGTVPTPHGPIEVDLTRAGGTVTIPPGITATVAFDAADADLPGAELGTGHHSIGSPS